MKLDIRKMRVKELSLIVFNTECLYIKRNDPTFVNELEKIFIFTNEQLDTLEHDLNIENEEV